MEEVRAITSVKAKARGQKYKRSSDNYNIISGADRDSGDSTREEIPDNVDIITGMPREDQSGSRRSLRGPSADDDASVDLISGKKIERPNQPHVVRKGSFARETRQDVDEDVDIISMRSTAAIAKDPPRVRKGSFAKSQQDELPDNIDPITHQPRRHYQPRLPQSSSRGKIAQPDAGGAPEPQS